ncbi:hypothetical protein HELRODRAFT_162882 [Helobdella robusta]|uniref:Uncharacterized protein n=1 Tax=Helobdella robusta TaxID=6412 RepID=T1ETB3_HELRO|nr:hypothetical protein HELRODRAFT_162882 [Helobdella robusta]ESN99350.1 hypothetical protein HELRODRAFT_162882 [Helobdella robusta]
MSELVAALTPSFSLENCAEEPTQRKRRASEARRSVPMSSRIEFAGESLADTQCPAAIPSLVDWMVEGQFYEREAAFPMDQAAQLHQQVKREKRPSRWGPELMAINIPNFNEEL